MKNPLLHALLAACVCWLIGSPDAAMARSRRSNNRNNRDRGFTGRIIDRDGDSRRDRERERKKKVEEQRKREADERKAKAEAKRKAREEKKQKAKEQREAQLKKAKEAREKRAKARGERKTTERKGDGKKEDGDAEAAKLLEKAEKEFAEGKLLPGVKALREILDEYRGTAAATDAQKRLDQLLATEPFGPMIYLGEAEELFNDQRYHHAQSKYLALLERYPEGKQADKARTRLAEIRDGDLLSKTRYTEEELEDARLWFLAGNIHVENGRRPEGMSAYRTAIENYPGCPYAQRAGEALAALRR